MSGVTARARQVWQRFRALPLWVQVVGGLIALGLATAPFSDEGQAPEADLREHSSSLQEAATSTTGTSTPLSTTSEVISTSTTFPLGLPAGDDFTVGRIIDGDTLELIGGIRVRLIGIDTPESTSSIECFGREAANHTTRLIPSGTLVRLVYDVDRRDRYGRDLAYVYRLHDGLFVNLALARDGFAQQLTIPPNIAHAEEFRSAVAEARSANRGLWSACSGGAVATTTTVAALPRPPPPSQVTPAPQCHPSYQGECLPPDASDVDCGGGKGDGPVYAQTKNIRVVGSDEYRLDADNDGLGCEE